MDYYKLLELQNLKLRREAMEKSYPRERELKLRKRKNQLLSEKQDLIVLEEKLRQLAGEIQCHQGERDRSLVELECLNREMYSGDHTPRELTVIQNRAESLEHNYLEIRQQVEEENSQASQRREELQDRRDQLLEKMKDYETKVEEYIQERNRLMEKLKLLDEQIGEFCLTLSPEELDFFEQEQKQYGTALFSLLKKGRFCGSCNVLLETEVIERVRKYETGVRCQNCGRMILNHSEDSNGSGTCP